MGRFSVLRRNATATGLSPIFQFNKTIQPKARPICAWFLISDFATFHRHTACRRMGTHGRPVYTDALILCLFSCRVIYSSTRVLDYQDILTKSTTLQDPHLQVSSDCTTALRHKFLHRSSHYWMLVKISRSFLRRILSSKVEAQSTFIIFKGCRLCNLHHTTPSPIGVVIISRPRLVAVR